MKTYHDETQGVLDRLRGRFQWYPDERLLLLERQSDFSKNIERWALMHNVVIEIGPSVGKDPRLEGRPMGRSKRI